MEGTVEFKHRATMINNMILILTFLIPATFHGENNKYCQEPKVVQADSLKQLWLFMEDDCVHFSTKNLSDRIGISVKDNGNEIPEEIKDKIFQSFFTTKPNIHGLSFAYDIIKTCGGKLRLMTKQVRDQ